MAKSVLFVFFIAYSFAETPVKEIKVDQAGYLEKAAKVALVSVTAPAQEFSLRRSTDGKSVFHGTLRAAVDDSLAGDKVQSADFSSFTKAGRYYVEVPGVGRSWDFVIGHNAYERAYYLAMRSFYGQRCGIAVDLGPEFPGYKHDACHLQGAYHASSGRDGAKTVGGGWHDAGDYGRYIVNSGLSTGTLLWTWELFGDRIRKISLKIPESGKGLPDILAEIKWNLDWMLSMQDRDGGVWHKQTSERFCGFIMPEKDTLTSYVIGTGSEPFKNTCATADFAAVMAIAARVYLPYDKDFAARAKDAALLAWSWLEKNPNVLFRNPKGVSTGAYGDGNCKDEMLWAAAELGRTAGKEEAHRYFLDHYAEFTGTVRAAGPMSWGSVGPMALWTYVLGKGKDAAAIEAIRQNSVKAANEIAQRTESSPYRNSMTAADYIWGSNGVAANYGVQLLVANAIAPDTRYVGAALDNLHYLLGRNTFSLSWVTAVGQNALKHPHHRPSGADANEEPWPGLLSGGPNHSKQDPAMRKLPDLPPAKMFVDEQDSYASNEIAINWNAPLVFLLAGAQPAK